MRELTCTKCGWVHMGVTRDFAEDAVRRFNDFYNSAAESVKECYGGQASIKTYERCFFCGGDYHNMRPSQDGDAPDGVTIQPMIDHETEAP